MTTKTPREFARACARHLLPLWPAGAVTPTVAHYLETGDESDRVVAYNDIVEHMPASWAWQDSAKRAARYACLPRCDAVTARRALDWSADALAWIVLSEAGFDYADMNEFNARYKALHSEAVSLLRTLRG